MHCCSHHHHAWSPFRIVLKILTGLSIAALIAVLFGIVAQWLWNALMPGLFHLPTLTWLQTVGLLLLARLFVGHPGGHHHPRGPWKRGGFPWHDRRQFMTWFDAEGKDAFESWKANEAG